MLTKRRAFTGAIAVVVALGLELAVLPVNVMAHGTITEIIDAAGDGAGNKLNSPWGVAVDGAGNVYVTGQLTHNAFQITPAGIITEIIDASGDGAGNTLNSPKSIAVDDAGNVYVTGIASDNAFCIAPGSSDTSLSCGGAD